MAPHGTEVVNTIGGLSQDTLPGHLLRQGGGPATDPLCVDLSCQPVLGPLPVKNPV